MSAIVDQISQSIARQEGYNVAGSIAQQNNNPGNLRTWGNTPVVNGYASFATPEDGWAALNQQVQKNIDRGLTLEEFFAGKEGVYPGYAPAADSNQPNVYAANVSSWTGIPLDVPLSDLASSIGNSIDFGIDFGTIGEQPLSEWLANLSTEAKLTIAVGSAILLGVVWRM